MNKLSAKRREAILEKLAKEHARSSVAETRASRRYKVKHIKVKKPLRVISAARRKQIRSSKEWKTHAAPVISALDKGLAKLEIPTAPRAAAAGN